MKKAFYPILPLLLLTASCDFEGDPPPPPETPDSAQLASDHIRDSILRAHSKQQLTDLMGNCMNTFTIPECKPIAWKLNGPLTDAESEMCGTWVAVMDDYGLRAQDVVVLADTASDKAGMGALFDAAKHGQRGEQKCAWLEFYEDHRGFWNSCIVDNGEPAQLVSKNLGTGKESASGLRFEWYMTDNVIHIQLEDCLKYPLPYNDKLYEAHVKYWDIQVTKTTTEKGVTVYTVNDYLPQYDYTSPVKVKYRFSKEADMSKLRDYQKPDVE